MGATIASGALHQPSISHHPASTIKISTPTTALIKPNNIALSLLASAYQTGAQNHKASADIPGQQVFAHLKQNNPRSRPIIPVHIPLRLKGPIAADQARSIHQTIHRPSIGHPSAIHQTIHQTTCAKDHARSAPIKGDQSIGPSINDRKWSINPIQSLSCPSHKGKGSSSITPQPPSYS